MVCSQRCRSPVEVDRRSQAGMELHRMHPHRRPTAKATPAQVKAEVWMALIHGSRGLIYFVHQFKPQFNEHALLDDAEMLAAVTSLNHEITMLAPLLNSPTVVDGGTVRSSDPEVPIDLMVKRRSDATYVFAVGMRNRPARGSFVLRGGLPAFASAQVHGEDRRSRSRTASLPTTSQPTACTFTRSRQPVLRARQPIHCARELGFSDRNEVGQSVKRQRAA